LQKKIGGEKSSEGITLNVKGGEKEQKKERNIRSMKTGGEIVKRRYIVRGNYPFPLMSKGERKIRAHEDRGRNGHRGSMSVSINAKGGDCWKVGCH
jgi:hypothetical protein